jgi:4-hydroxybenzoate polyprenyltransferase
MDVRDFEGDKKTRVTLPVQIGKKMSVYVASGMMAISILLLFVPFFMGCLGFGMDCLLSRWRYSVCIQYTFQLLILKMFLTILKR